MHPSPPTVSQSFSSFPNRWTWYQQMVPHLSLTPAVVGVLLVWGSSCSTAPTSTPPTSWYHPSTRLQRKVRVGAHVDPPERRFSYCFASPSGHRECLELLLSYGAHIDMELPVVGTPLYSACMAQAAACVMVLLHSGNVNTVTHRLIPPHQEKLGTCKSNFH